MYVTVHYKLMAHHDEGLFAVTHAYGHTVHSCSMATAVCPGM